MSRHASVRLGIISSPNRVVEHVQAYSYPNRWVGVGRACSDAWIVAGEIRRGQSNRHYRRRTAWRLVVYEQIKEHAASVLDRAANAAKQAGVPCDTIHVLDVQPYEAIIATATDRGCDLIVMGSHGRSGLSAVVLGGVTNKVLTYTKVPVLVVQ